MRILILCAIFALVLMPQAGFTQASKAPDPCENKQGLEWSNCVTHEFERADGELNNTYRLLMSKMKIRPLSEDGGLPDDERYETALKNAQRAWIAYRDSNCEYESSHYRDGAPMFGQVALCKRRMSIERTSELRSYEHYYD
jgi:uncharacterized protein YecT (DUF1311 family)